MSNTQFAFLKRDRVPTRQALQASIDDLGFDLQLDPALDLIKDEGFSPCTFYGTPEIGFELFSEPAADVIDDDEDLLAMIGEADHCISLIWRGSLEDCAAAMIVSCALAKTFGAVISYEGEPAESLDDLIEQTRQVVEEARGESAS